MTRLTGCCLLIAVLGCESTPPVAVDPDAGKTHATETRTSAQKPGKRKPTAVASRSAGSTNTAEHKTGAQKTGKSKPPVSVHRDAGQSSTAKNKTSSPKASKSAPPVTAGRDSGKASTADNKTGAQKATAARTKQGEELKDVKILIAAKTYFNVRDRLTFLQIEHEVDLYHALHGRYPKSWEEFDKEILKPAFRKLPELPPNKKYVFDSKNGQLMIAPVD